MQQTWSNGSHVLLGPDPCYKLCTHDTVTNYIFIAKSEPSTSAATSVAASSSLKDARKRATSAEQRQGQNVEC